MAILLWYTFVRINDRKINDNQYGGIPFGGNICHRWIKVKYVIFVL